MPDFTISTYTNLLRVLLNRYSFQTFIAFLEQPVDKAIILRHDVDARKENSLLFAQLQYKLGITGTYFFRIVPQSFNQEVIKQIAGMGHEIGYHYETMETSKGNVDNAYDEFCANLEILRKLVPIRTICMHGSPRSPFDNKDIWKKYNYKNLGLVGEPYYDIDFNEVAYLTDTGRRWNGSAVSVRDKVTGAYNFNFCSTFEIIDNIDKLPDHVMFTFHPQRWNNSPVAWAKELVIQNLKNHVKKIIMAK